MAKLYLNPAVRIPSSASISGKPLATAGTEAIVEPSEGFHADFYEQLMGKSLATGLDVQVYTTTPNQLAAMLDAQPDWMFAPQLSGDALVNVGRAGGENGVLRNSANLTGTALSPGTVSAVLDDTKNAFIQSNWNTRNNAHPDPLGLKGPPMPGTGDYAATVVPSGTDGVPAYSSGATMSKLAYDGVGESALATKAITLPQEGHYIISIPVWIPSSYDGGTLRGDTSAYTGETETETTPGRTDITKRDQWQILYFGITALSTDLVGNIAIRRGTAAQVPSSAATGTIYVGHPVVIEKTTTIPSEPILPLFPTVDDLATGRAAHFGETGNSVVDYGPFARNTSRTFVTFIDRAALGGNDVIIGSSGSESPRLILLTTNELNFRLQRAVSEAAGSFSTAFAPGLETAMVGVSFSDSANTMSYSINGSVPAQLTGKTAIFQHPAFYTEGLRIGIDTGTQNPFGGNMLPFAVYTRALTSAEMAAIYTP